QSVALKSVSASQRNSLCGEWPSFRRVFPRARISRMLRFRLVPLLLFFCAFAVAQERTITILTQNAFDGRGGVLRNVRIEIRGDKIVSVNKQTGAPTPATYDLRGFTVLPGWIDSHAHPTWHFGPNGHFGEKDELPERATLQAE